MSEAAAMAALLALDPAGLGGIRLRAAAGPAREAWLARLRGLLPAGAPWRRLPLHAPDARLLGGLDLAATLGAGRPIAERGLLAEAHGGILLAAMAERMAAGTAARLAAVLDQGEVLAERDGLTLQAAARFGLVALDEGIGEECPPAALTERLAFRLDLDAPEPPAPPPDIAAAHALLPRVTAAEGLAEALCGAALALGVDSLRAPILALRAARGAAALAGRLVTEEADARLAARLVLAHRATRLPAPPGEAEPQPPEPSQAPSEEDSRQPPPGMQELEEVVLQAALAALPPDLLATLRLDKAARGAGAPGRAGAPRQARERGRPVGTRAGMPRDGARLALVETLRAAAPWQRLRRPAPRARLAVRPEDLRILRLRQRSGTTAIFLVDASGSAALHRLAEAKGAVELLLADCYVRRDAVAVIGFRGRGAEILLPPTSSLTRAKRSLAGLPGGGGTPLAAAIEAGRLLAAQVRRGGRTPLVVLLTDGKANVARDGMAGRPQAEADALAAARALRAAAVPALLVDTAPRPSAAARLLAQEMGARHLPLPYADATALSQAVKAAA